MWEFPREVVWFTVGKIPLAHHMHWLVFQVWDPLAKASPFIRALWAVYCSSIRIRGNMRKIKCSKMQIEIECFFKNKYKSEGQFPIKDGGFTKCRLKSIKKILNPACNNLLSISKYRCIANHWQENYQLLLGFVFVNMISDQCSCWATWFRIVFSHSSSNSRNHPPFMEKQPSCVRF